MRFTTKTEYGLICLVYLARHTSADLVTIKEIVKKERFSATYIEKILQKLRAANIVVSHQGKQGGYELARKPSEITLREIVEALEGATFDLFCEPDIREEIVCTHFSLCGLKPIWQQTKNVLDHFFNSITLETIANQNQTAEHLAPAGLQPLRAVSPEGSSNE